MDGQPHNDKNKLLGNVEAPNEQNDGYCKEKNDKAIEFDDEASNEESKSAGEDEGEDLDENLKKDDEARPELDRYENDGIDYDSEQAIFRQETSRQVEIAMERQYRKISRIVRQSVASMSVGVNSQSNFFQSQRQQMMQINSVSSVELLSPVYQGLNSFIESPKKATQQGGRRACHVMQQLLSTNSNNVKYFKEQEPVMFEVCERLIQKFILNSDIPQKEVLQGLCLQKGELEMKMEERPLDQSSCCFDGRRKLGPSSLRSSAPLKMPMERKAKREPSPHGEE